jgi:hypothetical protein
MKCYRLEPIAEQQEHPDWGASPFYEVCWVTAYSEEDARRLVMDATLSFVDRDENSETLYSPWGNPALTTCEIDASPEHGVPPYGVVLTVSGKTYS